MIHPTYHMLAPAIFFLKSMKEILLGVQLSYLFTLLVIRKITPIPIVMDKKEKIYENVSFLSP